MSQENVELARRGLDALNRVGVGAIVDLCDPQIEWIAIPGFMPDAEDFHGHAGVRAWFDKIGESFSAVHWEAEEITSAGDRLLVTLKLAATGRASGIEGEFRVYQVWTITNGKLVRLESYLTRPEALKAVGLAR
jgi:ketosteroid isomerase-like protein